MNWVRAGMLLLAVLLAQGATPEKGAGTPTAGGNTDEIAAARDAVRKATAALGENHPVTAIFLRNLALAMQEGGYSNYADHYAQQSLAILEKRFGPNDVSLVPVLNVLTEAAVSEGRLTDAREYAVRAVGIGPDGGAHYGTALHNLGAINQAEGRFSEAADYYKQALAVRMKELPVGHPHIEVTRAALRRVQHAMKATSVAAKTESQRP